MQQTLQLLNYLATQEDAILSYHANYMVLAVHSNTSNLSKPKARSQSGGHFFLSSDIAVPPNNGAILNILKEYAQAEGVSAKLGVALELVADVSRRNEVPEMAEYCEKVPRSSARSHVLGTGRQQASLRSLVSTHFCGLFHHFSRLLD
jgi:hypothetical protein